MKEGFWKSLFVKRKEEGLEEFLKNTEIFSSLSRSEISRILPFLHFRTYRKGETVFKEGEPGVGLYIVRKGRVKLVRKVEEGSGMELAEVLPGEFFGEVAVIEGGPRTASAIVEEDAEMVSFLRVDLDEVLKIYPSTGIKIVMKIAEILARRLRETDEILAKFSNES